MLMMHMNIIFKCKLWLIYTLYMRHTFNEVLKHFLCSFYTLLVVDISILEV